MSRRLLPAPILLHVQFAETALHAAATIGSLPIVKLLIQNGASPNLKNKVMHGLWGGKEAVWRLIACWILALELGVGDSVSD